jgi:deazaflavin-dependent oxidoreductase (nitroreductase family)
MTFEKSTFEAVNGLLEPASRASLLSSAVWPIGVISLETTGRRTGRPHRVPVLAMHGGRYALAATARGRRSDWFRNIEANRQVRYWFAGQALEATAILVRPDGVVEEALPDSVACAVASWSLPGRLAGWRFVVLAPRVTLPPSP